MDKNAIKKYAVWARRELISRVSQRAALYEITADGYEDQNATSVHSRLMSAEEKKQRTALVTQIKEKGYEHVMEEIAYTWFNRFSALRFMEVNGYLPTRIRVFTNDDNAFKPQILDEAINMEMDGLDMQKVYDLKNANDDDALFKYMIITQCNALSSILPGMFQRISDYTELLFPDNLLREGSVVEQMVTMIPQEDWTDQVQIIGWLYQYYNTEPKDQVFANLKKNIKISKENIPAATQLFTPDWIVRYMVENSLGRLWLEGHPNDDLKAGWKYYLDEAEQEPEVQAQLAEIRKEYASLKPEEILAIDPCQGSGHILAYMFDVLVQIYEAYGYSAREAASSIVEHNIWGLDIDERAAQLAYFSVMMKARQYDRRFFSRGIQPHVYAILESNNLDPHCIEYFVDGRKELKSAMDTLVKELHDAKEYGSILNVTQVDFGGLYARFDEIRSEAAPSIYSYQALDTLLPFVHVGQAMAQKYHAVVTNPPYMGAANMNLKLNQFIKENYADYKSDFFSAFIVHCSEMTRREGYCGFFSPYVWMFIQTYEKMRRYLYSHCTIETLIQFEYSAFEEATVPVCSFAFANRHVLSKKGGYFRLTSFRGGMEIQREKTLEAIKNHACGYYFEQTAENYLLIPKAPIVYWFKSSLFEYYKHSETLDGIINSQVGTTLGDNDKFMRMWFEVSDNFADKWYLSHKGGSFRRWYGNVQFVIDWEDNGKRVKENGRATVRGEKTAFEKGISWTQLTAGKPSFRVKEAGSFIESASCMCTINEKQYYYVLGLLNSNISAFILDAMNPTMHFQPGDIGRLPWNYDSSKASRIDELVKECIYTSRTDWNTRETSYNFVSHPLVQKGVSKISEAFNRWAEECENRFNTLQRDEEELNRLYIEIYGLQGEVTENVEEKEVTVKKADLEEDIKSLISYAVGCMLGRFSIDAEGIAYAGGKWDGSKYRRYLPDEDGIIPICDDEYFEDDIVGRFVEFIRIVYGDQTLEENLQYIAGALGGKGASRDVIRNYFLNEFYTDHCSTYSVTGSGKRPIYWLFDSGKKNGFKCLIYVHRYQPDTIARIRTDYVHEQQSRYRTALEDLESRVANAGAGERVKLNKQLSNIRAQAEELRNYEEKIHHLADQMIRIDLDDGIKQNYAVFQDVLAKVK